MVSRLTKARVKYELKTGIRLFACKSDFLLEMNDDCYKTSLR